MKKVVNAIILNKNKFLLIKRKYGIHKGRWAFPGGVSKKGETSEKTLKREIKEEVGLKVEKIIRKISEYKYKRNNKEKTKGESYLINVKDKKVKKNNEIEDFKWTTIEELENLEIIPNIEEEVLLALFE